MVEGLASPAPTAEDLLAPAPPCAAGAVATPLDFSTLYEAGVRQVQALSGSSWTDFNDHDPGVTILQQVCYALSEVAYRVDFPIAELVSRPGDDGGAQALYTGDRILTCAPVTLADLRKVLFDKVFNLRNAWIEDAGAGLFRVYAEPYVFPCDETIQRDADPRPAMRAVLAANRPFCQDALEIVLLDKLQLTIDVELTIGDDASADDIAASLITELDARLVPAPSYRDLDGLLAEGRAPDAVFDGPLLDLGMIEHQVARPSRILVADIARIIRSLTGVSAIERLTILADGIAVAGEVIALGHRHIPAIAIAPTIERLRLLRNGVVQRLDPARIGRSIRYFESKITRQETVAAQAMQLAAYRLVPFDPPRDLARYTPVREHFPAVYGIGREGLPGRGSIGWIPDVDAALRRRQADALKTYLHGFDRIMADMLAQLQHVPDRFDITAAPDAPTYFAADLGELRDPASDAILEGLDPKRERREAMLDHLLARFDQGFDDVAWTHFGDADPMARLDKRIEHKAVFLQTMVDLGARRGCGDTSSQNHATGSAITGRIQLLTGIDDLAIVEHILLRDRDDKYPPDRDDGFSAFRASFVLADESERIGFDQRAFVERTIGQASPVHFEWRCLWLAADATRDFRALFEPWRERPSPTNAGALRAFLLPYWREPPLSAGRDDRW